MKVKELIDILQKFDPDTEVATKYYSYFNCIGIEDAEYIYPDEEINDLYESNVSLCDGKVIIECD